MQKQEKKKTLTEKEIERQKGKIEYVFAVGVDLFSRYAFVKLWRRGKNISDKDMIKSEKPTEVAELEGYVADKADDGVADKIGADKVTEAIKEWFKEINQMGFDQVKYLITDDGTEYKGKLDQFLKSVNTIHGICVPNDRVKNPIAERFIGTFKRLFGQLTAMKGTSDITQKDVDDIVNFYNNRVHSSTDYSPIEILDGISINKDEINITKEDSIAPLVFNSNRIEKGLMYYTMPKSIPNGSVVRIYTKWKTADQNLGDLKTNVNNWSYSLYRVDSFNRSDNHYILSLIGEKDPRDLKVEQPSSRGLRKEHLLVIDYDAFKRFN